MQLSVPGFGDLTAAIGSSPEDVLAAVVEASQDAVLVCDRQGAVVAGDDTAVRLFGYPTVELVGRALASLFAGRFAADLAQLMDLAGAGARAARLEGEAVRRDGLPVPVVLSCSAVPAGPTGSGAVVVVVRDVTEQRITQATLAEVHARLRDGEARSHVGSWLWDRRTGAVQWSVEFHRLHGLDPLEFGGTFDDYLLAVDPADRAGLKAALDAAVSSGRPFELEYRPALRPVRLQVQAWAALGSEGDVVGLHGVGRPCTA